MIFLQSKYLDAIMASENAHLLSKQTQCKWFLMIRGKLQIYFNREREEKRIIIYQFFHDVQKWIFLMVFSLAVTWEISWNMISDGGSKRVATTLTLESHVDTRCLQIRFLYCIVFWKYSQTWANNHLRITTVYNDHHFKYPLSLLITYCYLWTSTTCQNRPQI